MVRVDESSESATGVIRLSLFAFRRSCRTAIRTRSAIMSGTGLVTPVFS